MNPKEKDRKFRFALEMRYEAKELLGKLEQQTNVNSMGEVVRNAVATYDVLVAAVLEGGQVLIERLDGSKAELVIAGLPVRPNSLPPSGSRDGTVKSVRRSTPASDLRGS